MAQRTYMCVVVCFSGRCNRRMSKQYRSAHLTRRGAEAGLNQTLQPAAASTTRNYPLLPKPLSTKRRPARRKIAISTISLAEVAYLIEKNRLLPSAYDELTQALADPEHVFTEAVLSAAIVQAMQQVSRAEVPKYRTCRTVWWRQLPSISMCR
jgi:hypothetical protein